MSRAAAAQAARDEGLDRIGWGRRLGPVFALKGVVAAGTEPTVVLPHSTVTARLELILDRRFAPDRRLARDVAIATTAELRASGPPRIPAGGHVRRLTDAPLDPGRTLRER